MSMKPVDPPPANQEERTRMLLTRRERIGQIDKERDVLCDEINWLLCLRMPKGSK